MIPYNIPLKVATDNLIYPINMGVSAQTDIGMRIGTEIQIVDGEHYDGEYTVTPLAHDQTVLGTSGLFMEDDVTVLKVPYAETSNTAGGKTAVIA